MPRLLGFGYWENKQNTVQAMVQLYLWRRLIQIDFPGRPQNSILQISSARRIEPNMDRVRAAH